MNWTIVIITAAIFVAFFVAKRMSFVSADVAREHLAQGALVIACGGSVNSTRAICRTR